MERDQFCSVDLLAVIQDAKWQAFFSPQSSASQIQEGGAGELDVKQRVVGEGDKREGNQGGAGELDVKPGVVGEGDMGEGEGNQILTLDGEGESKHSSQQSRYVICTRIQ